MDSITPYTAYAVQLPEPEGSTFNVARVFERLGVKLEEHVSATVNHRMLPVAWELPIAIFFELGEGENKCKAIAEWIMQVSKSGAWIVLQVYLCTHKNVFFSMIAVHSGRT